MSAGAVTWLVNPADDDEAAELHFGQVFEREPKMEMTKVDKPKAPAAGKGRRNGGAFEFLVSLLLPFALGGGLGVLDGLNPRWWARLSFATRAFILVGVALAAKNRGRPEVYGGAMALAGRYLALWVTRKVQSSATGAAAQQPADAGAFPLPTDEQMNLELEAAAQAMAAERERRGLAAPSAADMGAIPRSSEARRAFKEVLVAAQAA